MVLERITGYRPDEAAEKLRDRESFLKILLQLGGPESLAYHIYARHFRGEATDADAVFVNDLRLARDITDKNGLAEGELAEYLLLYTHELDLLRRRRDGVEPGHSEKRALALELVPSVPEPEDEVDVQPQPE